MGPANHHQTNRRTVLSSAAAGTAAAAGCSATEREAGGAPTTPPEAVTARSPSDTPAMDVDRSGVVLLTDHDSLQAAYDAAAETNVTDRWGGSAVAVPPGLYDVSEWGTAHISQPIALFGLTPPGYDFAENRPYGPIFRYDEDQGEPLLRMTESEETHIPAATTVFRDLFYFPTVNQPMLVSDGAGEVRIENVHSRSRVSQTVDTWVRFTEGSRFHIDRCWPRLYDGVVIDDRGGGDSCYITRSVISCAPEHTDPIIRVKGEYTGRSEFTIMNSLVSGRGNGGEGNVGISLQGIKGAKIGPCRFNSPYTNIELTDDPDTGQRAQNVLMEATYHEPFDGEVVRFDACDGCTYRNPQYVSTIGESDTLATFTDAVGPDNVVELPYHLTTEYHSGYQPNLPATIETDGTDRSPNVQLGGEPKLTADERSAMELLVPGMTAKDPSGRAIYYDADGEWRYQDGSGV
jgi:hypothetical protein